MGKLLSRLREPSTWAGLSVLGRLREPSTWAGLSVLGVLFGAPEGALDAVGQIVGGVAALGAIVLAERK